jgi:hypothetical protein
MGKSSWMCADAGTRTDDTVRIWLQIVGTTDGEEEGSLIGWQALQCF